MNTSIDDLPASEIARLSNEDLDRYFKLACAESGLPISDPPAPAPPEKFIVAPDIATFIIGDYAVRTHEEAIRIFDALASCELLDLAYCNIEGGYTQYIQQIQDTPSINNKMVYSSSLFEKNKAYLALHNQAKAEYAERKKHYDQIVNARAMVAAEIERKRSRAIRHVENARIICDQMREYEELAGGDLEIAFRFLKKLHPDVETDYPEVFSGGWLRYTMLDRAKNGPPNIQMSEAQLAASAEPVEDDDIPF